MVEMKNVVRLENSNTNRFNADEIAKKSGGRIASNAQLDAHILSGKRGGWSFWAREFISKGILVEKGKDLFCKETNILVGANEISKAHETSKNGIFGNENVLLFIDPDALVRNKDGIYVLENPKISVVDNAILEFGCFGSPDPDTRIAVHTVEPPEYETTVNGRLEWHYSSPLGIRWNFFKDGVWPITRPIRDVTVCGVSCGGRGVEAFMAPTYIAEILVELP
ncbi:MAG: hypothetical protein WC263_04125 [Candidatus Micrarchaeia archaeon]|jgi:hypothetical protein